MRLVFDGFEIDPDTGQLFRADREVPLERRAFEMLCYLAAHPGRLISKEELLAEVWQAQTLSDGVLSNAAAKLRGALGQATGAREPIETVRGRGYRWHPVPRRRAELTPAAGAHTEPPRCDPFVGRASVMETLERALDQAAAGNGQLVMLVGDAGIGKTRTLEELAKRARARGLGAWEGACCDGGAAPPYWPWVEVLRAAHADLSRAMFRRYLPADSWAMASLVPELAGMEATSAGVDAQATRFRLFDEVARFITAACADAARLIVLDDLQWADEGTLELLAHVTRTLKKRAVMLVVTSREDEAREHDARAAVMQRLTRHATHVPLSGLSGDEVGELVSALDGHGAHDARLTEALLRRTQGNPFFLRQTLALLAQRGSSWNGEELALPPAVRDILRQRIEALGGQARSVLQMAAAAGTEFDAGFLADVLGVPLAELLRWLEPARRKGVVLSHEAPHRFAFAHVLLRDAIYDQLTLAERGNLHARLGRALAERPAGDDPRHLGEVARHFLLAVPPELDACVRHCRSAAAAARQALGIDTAAELLSRADDKLANEGGDSRLRCELLLELSLDRFHTGDVRNAWRALTQAAAIAEQAGASDLLARCACRLATWLELGGGGDEVAIRRLLVRALDAVGDRDPDSRAALLAHRAEIHFELSAEERSTLLTEAESLAAARGTPHILLEVATCRASLRDPTQLEETRRAVAAYRALAQRHGGALAAPQRLAQGFAVELSAYLAALTARDLEGADGTLERCRRLAEETQVMAMTLGVELMQAGRALGDGKLDELQALVARMSQNADVPGGFGLVWRYYMGRLIEARGGMMNWTGVSAELPTERSQELRPGQLMNGTLLLARLNARLGAHERARQLLASVPREQLIRAPVRHGDLGMLCFLAETYEALDDRTAGAELYLKLLPYADLNAVGPAFDYGGSIEHYLGALAALAGRHVEAVGHFERAELANERLRMPLQQAASAARRASAQLVAGR